MPIYLSHLMNDNKPHSQIDYTDHRVDILRLFIVHVLPTLLTMHKHPLLDPSQRCPNGLQRLIFL